MNKVFKVIWSKAKNMWVVASELAKSHTKAPNSGIVGYASLASLEFKINMDLSKGFVAGVFPMVNRPIAKFSDFKITVAAIVKNEAENVPTWVQAARSCADEIVVVDTGSTDDTVKRFKDYGITCYHYDWNDDFASAKNYMISLCHGDWIVLLDGDEWFREGCDVRKAIAKHHNNPVTKAIIADWICLDKDRGNAVMFSGGAVRAFRNQPDVRYFRKVHENLTINFENFAFEPEFKMYHTGYSGSVNRSKHERNLRIMRTMFDFDNGKVEYPTDWRYIEDTYAGLGEFDKALWAADKMISYGVQEYSASAWVTKFNVLFAMKTSMEEMMKQFAYCFKTAPSVSGFRFLASVYYARNGRADLALDEYTEGVRMLMGPQDKVAIEHSFWRMYLPEASALMATVCLESGQLESALSALYVSEQYCGKTQWTDGVMVELRRRMAVLSKSPFDKVADKALPLLQFAKRGLVASAMVAGVTIGILGNVNDAFAASYAVNNGKADGTNAIAIGGCAKGNYSITIGNDINTTYACGCYSIAFNGRANKDYGIGIGGQASGIGSIGIGGGAYYDSSIAVGYKSSITFKEGVAIGYYAGGSSTSTGGVALGSHSIVTTGNTVSLGHTTSDKNVYDGTTYTSNLRRRIVNMANGTSATDGATVAQTSTTVAGTGITVTSGTNTNGSIKYTIAGKNMTAATASAAGTAGLVPAPAAGKQASFLRGDGTWAADNDTHWTSHMYVGSGTAANAATTNGNTKIALADNSTVRNTLTIKGTGKTTVTSDANGVITINSTDANTTYSNMTAATASAAGAAGLVPAPAAGKQGQFLRGDGTWATPTNTTYAALTADELNTGTATTSRAITAKVLGDYVKSAVSDESSARTTAISSEQSARTDADTALSTRIDGTIKGLSISGQTITYTKGDGTTGSITTQDNNTTYSAGNGLELDGSQFKAKAGANVTVDTDGISVAGNGTVADGNTGLISGGTLYNEVHIGTDGTYVKGGQSVAQNFSSLDTQVKANKDTLAEHAVSISNLQSASGNYGSTIATKANRDMDDLTETGSGVIKNLAKASVNVAGSALASVQKTDVNGVDTYTVSIAADGTVSDGNASLVSGGTVYNALQSVKSELSDTLLAAQGTLQGSIDGKADVSLGNIDNNGENVVRSLAKESVKMIAGTHTTVTEGADGDAKTYTVDVKTDGTVSENNTGIVTGGSVYDAIQAEQAARNAGDIALSGRIGTIESDKNYVLKDSSVSDNLVVLDGKVKLNADDITGLKDLDNITAAGEAVIRDLSKGSISMTGSGYATVTKSAENGVDTYNVSVKAEGSVSNGNIGLVDGGTVYDAIGNAVTVSENLTAAVLANKADKDAYNVTDSVAWAAKLDTGAVAENNGELVSGGKVYTAVNTARQVVEAKIGTISEDGRYITVAHNVFQNLSSLDTGLKTTAEGLAAEVVNRTAADTELGNRIGTVTSDGNYILASNTVSQNLSALDSKIGTASSAEGTYTSGSNTINANLKALDTQVKAVGEALTFTDANSVKYDGAEKTKVTLAGNGGTTVGNVKDAILSAESSEAVTGRQLYATNTNIATEIRARQDADTSLSNRIGTVASDGNYIKKADSASANLVTLDWMLKSTSDALATEKAERETVNTEIQGQVNRLSGNTVQYESASMDTVTMKGASGTKLTNLQEGLLAENSSDAVTGRQLYAVSQDLLKEVSARAAADTALGQRIDDVITSYTVADNALGSRIDKESEARAQADSALDKRIGKLASDGAYIDKNKDVSSNLFSLDRQLKATTENLSSVVAGNTTELSERIGTLDSDGNYIEKSANNSVYKNISKLDSKLKETSDGLSGEKVERMEADKELSARIGILASDGKYIKKNSDVSQNLFALDAQLRDNTDKISENKDAINALSEKSAADISGLEKRIQANKEGVEAVNRQEGAILPVGEARSDEFVRGKTVYEYLNGDELRMGRNSTRLSVGKGSLASGNQSIALGFDNEVSGNNSGSFGDPNTVTGDGSYAIGNDIAIGGNNTFVFGSNVEANVDNAVVLGHESVAEKDAVSVGSEGKERQIKHVAPGTDPNDAATVGQLEAMGMNAYNNSVALSDGIKQLDNKINKVGAGAAALASLHPIDMDNKFGIAAGVGNYRNATAMAMGLFYRPKENIMFNVGGTIGNGASMISAGVTVALDKGFSTSKAAMAKAIRAQAEENQRLKNQLGVQQAELEKQKEEIAELREMVKKLAKSS